jgi:glycosyltransferase involved in cell wall biosynthesis
MALKPVVTVGICVRNGELTIRDAIESISNQDFPHQLMELILVDDGSEDRTLPIINELAARIDIPAKVFHTSWKGVGHARNIVVQNAMGTYVLWVDGDMTLSRNYVRKEVEYMQEHPNVGIAKGKNSLQPTGKLLSTLETYSRAAGKMVDYTSDKTHSMALGTGGSIYRTNILRQVGGFDESLRGYGEDLDIEIRIRALKCIVSTNDAIFLDYERLGLTWKSLWSRYWRRGYYSHYFFHKRKALIASYKMIPPAALLLSLIHARKLFRVTHDRTVFFLPLMYEFKTIAWDVGYMRSHLASYEPHNESGVSPMS